MAIEAWRKQQRIDLLKTIAVCTATVNPEKASQALSRLIEEMFPEHKIERERAVDRAMEIMETERKRVYTVVPVGEERRKGGPMESLRRILRSKKPPRG